MPDANDMDLVRQFARHNSEAAFTELVQRRINLVYSVALRCTDDPTDAHDVTQAVFIILARKAARLHENTILTGWLYETTRFTAARLRRTNARRHAREQEAYMRSTLTEPKNADAWQLLAPHLEDAMSHLAARDRTLLALRFFENKSGPQAAAILGIREKTAYKRQTRAVEKLRKFFSQRGITLTAAAIVGAVSVNSVQAAPVALAHTISTTALTQGVATTSTLTLVKGALKIMAWTKMKTALVVGLAVVLAGGTTATVVAVKKHKAYEIALDSWRLPRFSSDIVAQALPQSRILPTKFKPPVYGQFWASPNKWAGVRVPVSDIVRDAYSWPPGRILFPAGEPPGRYDFAVTYPYGNDLALQEEIKNTFGLVGHPKTIDTDVLVLRVQTPDAPGLKPFTGGRISVSYDIRGRIICAGVPLSRPPPFAPLGLTKYLEAFLKMPVIDETGLTDRFDIDLKWIEREERDPDHAALKKALLDQLGLILVPDNRPTEMLVMEKEK